jgi:hypothetical protein
MIGLSLLWEVPSDFATALTGGICYLTRLVRSDFEI